MCTEARPTVLATSDAGSHGDRRSKRALLVIDCLLFSTLFSALLAALQAETTWTGSYASTGTQLANSLAVFSQFQRNSSPRTPPTTLLKHLPHVTSTYIVGLPFASSVRGTRDSNGDSIRQEQRAAATKASSLFRSILVILTECHI